MDTRCPACADPSLGIGHTCAGSGTWKAAEAHAAGAVDAIEQAWPIFQTDLQLRVRGLDEDIVRSKLRALMSQLLDDDQVIEVLFTIRQEEAIAA